MADAFLLIISHLLFGGLCFWGGIRFAHGLIERRKDVAEREAEELVATLEGRA